jgi:hypothetical protein
VISRQSWLRTCSRNLTQACVLPLFAVSAARSVQEHNCLQSVTAAGELFVRAPQYGTGVGLADQ